MRTMERNKQTVWYANCTGKEEILSDGRRTGQYRVAYSTPVKLRANVSPARGSLSEERFGIHENYDRTIVTDQTDIDIGETSVLWVEAEPDSAWDYVAASIARSINSVTIAIRKVSG